MTVIDELVGPSPETAQVTGSALVPVPAFAGIARIIRPAIPSELQDAEDLQPDQDAIKICEWLSRYQDTAHTLSSYRKEAIRFYAWVRWHGKHLRDLHHADVAAYLKFLAAPDPGWVAKRSVSRSSPEWRPFRGPLRAESIRQAEIILNGMLTWLVSDAYLESNPMSLVRVRRRQRHEIKRFLSRDQWQAVLDSIEALPRGTREAAKLHARDRWMVRLIYTAGLRISEAADHTMGDVRPRDTKDGVRWSLHITGKGEKLREIPVTSSLLSDLKAYRVAMGLSPLPSDGEATPLIAAARGEGGCLTRSGLYLAVKQVFRRAAKYLLATQGIQSNRDQANLLRASPHWLRHTRASHLLGAGVSVNSVREVLGHASLATTSLYAHEEQDRVQAEVERADFTETND